MSILVISDDSTINEMNHQTPSFLNSNLDVFALMTVTSTLWIIQPKLSQLSQLLNQCFITCDVQNRRKIRPKISCDCLCSCVSLIVYLLALSSKATYNCIDSCLYVCLFPALVFKKSFLTVGFNRRDASKLYY